MLESTNDYMSILAIVFLLIAMFYMVFQVISIKVTARNLQQEAEYYAKDRRKLEGK